MFFFPHLRKIIELYRSASGFRYITRLLGIFGNDFEPTLVLGRDVTATPQKALKLVTVAALFNSKCLQKAGTKFSIRSPKWHNGTTCLFELKDFAKVKK